MFSNLFLFLFVALCALLQVVVCSDFKAPDFADLIDDNKLGEALKNFKQNFLLLLSAQRDVQVLDVPGRWLTSLLRKKEKYIKYVNKRSLNINHQKWKLQVESLSVSKTTPATMATPSRLCRTKVDDPALWKDICRVFNSGSNEGSSYESVKFHTAWSFESA
ncbi:hypothetical protein RUM44_010777 [Polyplax serrata]|uniref:Secreted protein n=1 Tax=Polyplax serrata TaxID=468196 RepID=A0ABR1AN52_POLSC